jgi:glycine/D-amino acid oxidase-like deaminating enzyme
MPIEPTPRVVDILIVGAGFSGLCMLYKARQLGRCRWHLVSQLLSGRAGRCGEHGVFLPVLRRVTARVAMD